MSALQWQSLAGMGALCLLAWVLGGCRRGVSARVVVAGLASVLGLAALLLNIAWLRTGFGWIGQGVEALARATRAGTSLVFGYLGGGPLPFPEPFPGAGFILFFQALPLVLVVGALSAVLFHWGCWASACGCWRAGCGASSAWAGPAASAWAPMSSWAWSRRR
ncbi:Na+ dependent nucleoside transporter N-terminal domain-containing protein [Roseococcus microcysteis]|uniref:Na+ dependent nucleoside transporter N-terminal domain-containing protein n=1 Tax=Roseococcus microcysteis TaxID=2771361 RepID=UPI001CC55740|nr:Na+ dependent nucleoside transporter N-terminal domain-containing protein [Roseococcus microcysteis]